MKSTNNIVLLKDLCNNYKQDIVDGPFGSNLTRSDYLSDGIPVLKIQNVKPFSIELKKMDYVSKIKYQELKRHSYTNGDIVMTKLGDPLGASAIVEDMDDGLIVADIVRIRAQKINTKYLCYHLNSPITSKFINSLQKGTTRPRVRIDNVRNLPIYVPPLPEQQRIVTLLDETFAGLAQVHANAERNLVNAREVFEAAVEETFSNPSKSWKKTIIGEEVDLLVGFAFKSKGYTDSADGIRLLRGDNIIQGSLRWDGVKKWKSSEYDEYATYALKEGDLVLAMDRPWVKAGLKYSMISKSDLPSLLVQRTACLRSGKNLLNSFLKYVISSRKFIEHILGVQTGIGVPHISGGQIKDFEFFLPPLEEQRAIVQRLDALAAETSRLEAVYQSKLEAVEELRKSVLKEAFEGRL